MGSGLLLLLLLLPVLLPLATAAAASPNPASPSSTAPKLDPSRPRQKPRIIRTSEQKSYNRQGAIVHLHCSVTGNPRPRLTWYSAATGRPVITQKLDPVINLMVLSNDDLLISGLSRANEGSYYCNASNSLGFVLSPNISIHVAHLGRKFQHSPQSKSARVGETVQMECRPPKGRPAPKVTWTKNDKPLDPNDPADPHHYIILDNGNLRINQARLSDKGRYRCVAENIDGSRRSKAALLEVRLKPRFVRQPQDKYVSVNDNVRFRCIVTGDPTPVIIWRREDGSQLVPSQRTKILPDKSLLIERVQLSDEGKYVCNASNSAGRLEAVAKLTVSSPPSFYRTPEDKTVAIGQQVTFHCEVAGRPKPDVYWETNNKNLYFAGKSSNARASHIKVFDDGRLLINSVRKSDAGRYVCHANSYSKQIRSSAVLKVEDRELNPPPMIDFGPQNQTLLEGSTAVLRCIPARSHPATGITWHKGRLQMAFDFQDHRIIKLPNGVLQIADVSVRDSANYTCTASLGHFKTRWPASLRVLSKSDEAAPRRISRAQEDVNLFPKRPSRLRVTDVGDTWAALVWEVSKTSYMGVQPVLSYQIEQFSPEDRRGWVLLEPNCKDMKFKVRNLKPETEYYFLVRASNIHGLGRPLRLRQSVRTRPKLNLLPDVLRNPNFMDLVKVQNLRLHVTGHDTMKVMWNVKGPDEHLRAVSGFVVRYKAVSIRRCLFVAEQVVSYTYCSLKSKLLSDLTRDEFANGYSAYYKETREFRQDVNEHVSKQTSRVGTIIKDLRPFSCYEVDVEPFFRDQDYGRIAGRVSSARRALTYDSVPSAPPTSIAAKWLTNSSVELRWGPPPLLARNGVITGYNVHVIANESRFNKFVETNASSHSLVLYTMLPKVPYTIHLAARTCKGEGIRSIALKLSPVPDNAGNHFLREPWFICTMIGCGLLWTVLCVITIVVCKRYCQQKVLLYKPVLPAYSNGTLKDRQAGANGPCAAGTLTMRSLGGADSQGPPPDLTTMLQEKAHLELVVEEGGPAAPVITAVSPYATTSLITSQAFSPPPYSNSDSTSGGKASSCPYVQGGGQGSYECRSCSDCGSHATAEELEAILQGPVRLHAPPQGPQPGVQVAQAAVQQRAAWPSSAGQGTTTPPRHKVLNIGVTSPTLSGRTSSGGGRSGSSGGASSSNLYHQLLPPGEQAGPGHQAGPPRREPHREEDEDGDYSDLSDRCDSPDFHSSLLGEASETCPSVLASAYSDSDDSEDPDMSSVVSSVASEDEAFLSTERDFASSVQMAADAHGRPRPKGQHSRQGSGQPGGPSTHQKGGRRHHHHHHPSQQQQQQQQQQSGRPSSPGYSTDSTNYGHLPPPKKPYPKSQRRRQGSKDERRRMEKSQQQQQQQQQQPQQQQPQQQQVQQQQQPYAFGNHPVA